jgi:hypothetical protein
MGRYVWESAWGEWGWEWRKRSEGFEENAWPKAWSGRGNERRRHRQAAAAAEHTGTAGENETGIAAASTAEGTCKDQ